MSERFLFSEKERKIFGFFFFGFALMDLLYRWQSGVLVSQIGHPALVFPSTDMGYWILLLTRIPQYFVRNHFAAGVFDVMLVGSAAMAAVNCNKREYPIVFVVFIWLYFVIFNIYSGHHYHGLIGLLVLSIPFVVEKPKTFATWMEIVRYYYLFLFSSAALWKLLRGAAFHHGDLKAILMKQHVGYLYYHPESFHAQLVNYLVQHAALSDIFLVSLFLLQLSFIIGFITHKFDGWLFVGAVFFHLMNWMVMRVFSVELIVLNLTLVPWQRIFPMLNRFFIRKKDGVVVES